MHYPLKTIRTTLTELQAQQNYVLHIDTASTENSLPAAIELIVNSTTNATITAVAEQQMFWDIPASQLVAGTNTFTIRYAGGEANWLSWDWLEICGSWQVGLDNGTQSEFTRETDYSPDYFLSDPVWKHCRRAVTIGNNVQLNFTLSQEVLERYLFTYTSEIILQGGDNPTPPHKLRLEINGNIITNNLEVADNTVVTFPDVKASLVAGNNSIVWRNVDTGGWAQFDYHKMEMALPPGAPKGTLIIIR
ncbi:MAG: hypothetical protein PHO37_17505 [Kiritimatiellae bacterium]|nr:hypothetical protein [Kiritimatiellia bacterium]